MEGGAPARPGGGGGRELWDTSEAPPDHCGDQDTFRRLPFPILLVTLIVLLVLLIFIYLLCAYFQVF